MELQVALGAMLIDAFHAVLGTRTGIAFWRKNLRTPWIARRGLNTPRCPIRFMG